MTDETTTAEVPESEETGETTATVTEDQETKFNKYHRETVADLILMRQEVRESEREHELRKSELKEAKASLEGKQSKLNLLVDQLEDVENGNYQPMLDFPEDPAPAGGPDPAKTTSIEDLLLPEGQTDKLLENEVETVADLENMIKAGKIQYISGIGPAAIDKITDRYLKWREDNPIPIPEDAPESTEESEGEEAVAGE